MKLRPFQIVLLSTFTFLAILAIILVKGFQPSVKEGAAAYGERVVVWGSIDSAIMSDVMNQITIDDPDFNAVQYVYVDERSFDEELVNAIAEGRSPDLVVLRSDALVKHRAKLLPIPYDTISERSFRDSYVDGADIFMLEEGVYALPFAVDPLVMYWNRDMFSSNGLAQPPASWEALVTNDVPSLTIRDTSRNILQSAVAMGEYRNVVNAKAILMSLIMQSGSSMVSEDSRGYNVKIDKALVDNARPPMDAALQFYIDFSNSASPLYTWNRVQPSDKNAFISEDLAIYFGLGSEAKNIADKNPNLNFDLSSMPQGAAATVRRTYGDFYGFAIPNAAYNKQGAYTAANKLGSAQYSQLFTSLLGMASPYRSVITAGEKSPYRQIILQSALIAKSWLDPDKEASDQIFSEMVEDVVSNRTRISNAVIDAVRKLTFEY